jgi:hypothetical protein
VVAKVAILILNAKLYLQLKKRRFINSFLKTIDIEKDIFFALPHLTGRHRLCTGKGTARIPAISHHTAFPDHVGA